MPWCPKCLYVYREGFDHCPDCDVDLVMGEMPVDEKKEPVYEIGCPACGKAFPKGPEACPECGRTLVPARYLEQSVRERYGLQKPSVEWENPSLLARDLMVWKADMLAQLLADNSIPCQVVSQGGLPDVYMGTAVTLYQLFVRDADLHRAKDLTMGIID